MTMTMTMTDDDDDDDDDGAIHVEQSSDWSSFMNKLINLSDSSIFYQV